jgi:FRG domain
MEDAMGKLGLKLRVDSVQEFVEVVCGIRDKWIRGAEYFAPWFRGQTDATWTLEPSIFRYDLLSQEDEIRSEFHRKAPQYLTETPPSNYWEWYFLMQHYGAPTRLLDWSDSALVALYFALTPTLRRSGENVDAIVWMLDPLWLNMKVLRNPIVMLPSFPVVAKYLTKPYSHIDNKDDTRISPKNPAAIDPPFIARRIAVQRSHFTIFGKARDGLTRLAISQDTRLVGITLAKEKLERMQADLLTLGFSDTSIYPDLRGLSDELIRNQLGNWPPD